MKKISLKSIKREELLSREELKQILGGFEGSGDSGEPRGKCNCNTSDDCSGKDKCMADCDQSGGYYGHCAYSGAP